MAKFDLVKPIKAIFYDGRPTEARKIATNIPEQFIYVEGELHIRNTEFGNYYPCDINVWIVKIGYRILFLSDEEFKYTFKLHEKEVKNG